MEREPNIRQCGVYKIEWTVDDWEKLIKCSQSFQEILRILQAIINKSSTVISLKDCQEADMDAVVNNLLKLSLDKLFTFNIDIETCILWFREFEITPQNEDSLILAKLGFTDRIQKRANINELAELRMLLSAYRKFFPQELLMIVLSNIQSLLNQPAKTQGNVLKAVSGVINKAK